MNLFDPKHGGCMWFLLRTQRSHPTDCSGGSRRVRPQGPKTFKPGFLFLLFIFLAGVDTTTFAATLGFEGPINHNTGTNAGFVVVGDMNADGNLDLVVVNAGQPVCCKGEFVGSSVSISLGKGDGFFEPPLNYNPGGVPVSLAIGDFDGDSKLDLIVSTTGATNIVVLLGNGDGTLRRGEAYSWSRTAKDIAVGDFNGDGKLDVALASDSAVAVMLGKGNGTLTKPVDYGVTIRAAGIAIHDLDRDGKLDLIVANAGAYDPKSPFSIGGVATFHGNGDGTFQEAAITAVGLAPSALTVADFNRDGWPDVAVTPSSGTNYHRSGVVILLSDGGGSFRPGVYYDSGDTPMSVAAVDLNKDGIPDLAVANRESQSLSLRLGNGDGTFGPPVVYNITSSSFAGASVRTGDFDGDGKQDLAVAAKTMAIFLGRGDGTLRAPVNMPLSGALEAADLNGDKVPDLVVTGHVFTVDDTTFFMAGIGSRIGKPDGTFTNLFSLQLDSAPTAAVVADFNSDQKMDIAVTTFDRPDNRKAEAGLIVARGKGDGTFQLLPALRVLGEPHALLLGDFNTDGTLDLAIASGSVRDPGTGQYVDDGILILLGKGDLTFQPLTNYASGLAPQTAVVGDLNRDGKLDIVFSTLGSYVSSQSNYTNRGVWVLLGNGNGTFQAPSFQPLVGEAVSLLAADFSGDGKVDIIAGNQQWEDGAGVIHKASISFLAGKGDGTLQLAPPLEMPYFTALKAADLNGDGKLDLIAHGYLLSYMLGKGDGTFEPPVELAMLAERVFVADFNLDKRPDLLVRNSSYPSPFPNFLVSGGLFAMPNQFRFPGTLKISQSKDGFRVSWPISTNNFTLEGSARLGFQNWSSTTGVLKTNGDLVEVLLGSSAEPNGFFRLRGR